MGACYSSGETDSDSDSDRGGRPTASVISVNGYLRQYTVPVTASQVLHMEFPTSSPSSSTSSDSAAKFFVCNSDLLNYDDYIPALDAEHQLQPDQIYFILPVSKLQYRITASDMAALAVKATLALRKSSPNSNKSSSFRQGRHRQNKMARISPDLEAVNIHNNTSSYQRVSSSSSSSDDGYGIGGDNGEYYELDRNGIVVRRKKRFSDKASPAATLGLGGVSTSSVSVSVSERKLRRYSSRRTKKAVRSFRVRLTTIHEGSILQFY